MAETCHRCDPEHHSSGTKNCENCEAQTHMEPDIFLYGVDWERKRMEKQLTEKDKQIERWVEAHKTCIEAYNKKMEENASLLDKKKSWDIVSATNIDLARENASLKSQLLKCTNESQLVLGQLTDCEAHLKTEVANKLHGNDEIKKCNDTILLLRNEINRLRGELGYGKTARGK